MLNRPTLFIWVFLFLFSLNMFGWSLGGVNNVLIFELNPRDRLTCWHMATLATSFGVIWSLNLIIFLILQSRIILDYLPLFTYIVPIILNSFLLLFFIIRIDPFNLKSTKRWLQNVVMKEIKGQRVTKSIHIGITYKYG